MQINKNAALLLKMGAQAGIGGFIDVSPLFRANKSTTAEVLVVRKSKPIEKTGLVLRDVFGPLTDEEITELKAFPICKLDAEGKVVAKFAKDTKAGELLAK